MSNQETKERNVECSEKDSNLKSEEFSSMNQDDGQFFTSVESDISLTNEGSKTIQQDISLTDDVWIPDKAKKNYHAQRLAQSKWAFRLSFWGCLLGFVVIIKGIKISVDTGNIEWISIVSGVILESVAALFFHLNNMANEKISEFFKELTADSNKKDAQKLVKDIKNDEVRDEVLVKLALHLSGIDDEKICKNTKEVCKKGS